MMPTFGTRIPDITFEPIDTITLDIIRDDLEYVFSYDPRVETVSIDFDVNPDANSIQVRCILLYLELNVQQGFDFNIEFERNVN